MNLTHHHRRRGLMLPLIRAATLLTVAACLISIGCVAPQPAPASPDPFDAPASPVDSCPSGTCPDQSSGGLEISSGSALVNSLAAAEIKSADPFACPTCPQQRPPRILPAPIPAPMAPPLMVRDNLDPPAPAPTKAPAPIDQANRKRHPLTGELLPPGVSIVSIDGRPVGDPPATTPQPAAAPSLTDNAAASSAANIPKGGEVKHGAFRCEACGRPTVGRQWKEIWADDGTSLLAICRPCFDKSSPAQRETVLRAFATRTGLDLANPSIQSAIRTVSAEPSSQSLTPNQD